MKRAPLLPVYAWAALLILITGLSLKDYNSFQLGTYMDDSRYVVLARSIAFADTYALKIGPAPPRPTGYPFGFPLLLAPFAKLFSEAPERMQLIGLLATLLNASLLFWGWPLLSRVKSRWWALAVASLYAVAPLTFGHTRMVMSEPIFTTFALVALLLVERCLQREQSTWGHSLALGLALTFVLFTRHVGVALCAAVLLRLILSPTGRSLRNLGGILAGALSLLIPVLLLTPVMSHDLVPRRPWRHFFQPSARIVTTEEDPFTARFTRGIQIYAQHHLRAAVIPLGGGSRETEFGHALGLRDLPSLTGLAATGLVLLGAASQLFRRDLRPAVLLFEGMYLLTILLWYYRAPRLLYPIQPFLVYQLLVGIRLITSWILRSRVIAQRAGTRLPDVAVVTVVATFFLVSLYKDLHVPHSHEYVRDFHVGTTWLKERTPPDAVVMAQWPETVHLYASRQTVPYPTAESTAELAHFLSQYDVDYVFVEPAVQWDPNGVRRYDKAMQLLLRLLAPLEAIGRLTLVYESSPKEKVRIYHVQEEPPA